MTQVSYDIIVIGGGPGGYVAALKAAQLGFKVACVEERKTLGGTCLNVGCIPSKALLHASRKFEETQNSLKTYGINVSNVTLDYEKFMKYKDTVVADLAKGIEFLFKKNKVDFIQGRAEFVFPNEIQVNPGKHYTATYFIIATGSHVTALPGIDIDEQKIVSSTGALSFSKIPNHLIVIGGGYIGLELGSVWRRLGSQVTVVEFLDTLLPSLDREVSKTLFQELQKQGLTFKLGTKVTHIDKTSKNVIVTLETSGASKGSEKLEGDVVLCATGRRPYTQGLGLDRVGIRLDSKGFIPVNESFQTVSPSIYAIGDVIGGPMLAHKAEEEGVAVAEILAGEKPAINYETIPSVIYTYPEVAMVGKTEELLKEKSIPYKVGKFPFSANSRARVNGETIGFVKVLAHQQTDEILGIHIVHPEAGTMIAEAALAMEYRASSEDLARTCHAHPTVSEALKEGALAAYTQAIHV